MSWVHPKTSPGSDPLMHYCNRSSISTLSVEILERIGSGFSCNASARAHGSFVSDFCLTVIHWLALRPCPPPVVRSNKGISYFLEISVMIADFSFAECVRKVSRCSTVTFSVSGTLTAFCRVVTMLMILNFCPMADAGHCTEKSILNLI